MFFAEQELALGIVPNARNIHRFVYFAQVRPSVINLTTGRTVNGKSIIGLCSLGLRNGDKVTIETHSKVSQEQADEDLKLVVKWLRGEE